MRSGRMLGLAVAAAVTVAGAPAAAQDESIALGALFNTSGPQAIFDVPALHGARLAVETINAGGGVLGKPLALAVAGGASDAEAWAQKVPALLEANPDTVALFGLSDTDNALVAGKAAAAAERVFLTSGATSPLLPQDVPTWLFLAPFGDNVQAAAAAEWAFDSLGVRKAMVLFDPDETYPTLLKGYFAARFENLGGTVTAVAPIAPREPDPPIPDIGDADVVFLATETADDAARMIPQLREAGFGGPVLGGDGYDAAEVWSEHPDVEGVYYTTHVYLGRDNPDPGVTRFVAAYTEAVPGETPTAFSALAYDAAGLLAAAITNAGTADPAAVAGGLLAIDAYEGITGTIGYRDGDHIPRKSVTILEIAGGTSSFVTRLTPTEVPAP